MVKAIQTEGVERRAKIRMEALDFESPQSEGLKCRARLKLGGQVSVVGLRGVSSVRRVDPMNVRSGPIAAFSQKIRVPSQMLHVRKRSGREEAEVGQGQCDLSFEVQFLEVREVEGSLLKYFRIRDPF